MKKIIIIGNGISGITAARHLRKLSTDQITVISKETDYFFSRTALMYVYMGHMKFEHTQPYEPWFWEKNNIQLLRAEVNNIDFSNKTLQLSNQSFDDSSFNSQVDELTYDILIIATGSKTNKFGWPGQELENVFGMYSYQDLEKLENLSDRIEHAVIVGGGLIGIELAEMLHSRRKKVTLLVREQAYWHNVLPMEEAEMVNQQIANHHINLRLSTELSEILSDEQGKVRGILTTDGEEISCQYVGLTAGVHPNIEWLQNNKEIDLNRGILVDEFLKTNQADVYAIGDCAELRNPPMGRRSIEAVWYVGRIMGETVAHTICGRPTSYQPGHWFNSAKFLDLEYQVYGQVPANLEPPLTSFYWQKDNQHSLRIVYDENTQEVVGFNLMGIRFRHEVCDYWLTKKTPVAQVVKELDKAHFDPEFYRKHYQAIQQKFTHQHAKASVI